MSLKNSIPLKILYISFNIQALVSRNVFALVVFDEASVLLVRVYYLFIKQYCILFIACYYTFKFSNHSHEKSHFLRYVTVKGVSDGPPSHL